MNIFANAELYNLHIPCNDIIDYALENSMLSRNGFRLLYELALMADLLTGCAAEAGVGSGGVIYLLASVMMSKTIYGFDSWIGLPKATEEDLVNGKPDIYEGWGHKAIPTSEMMKELDKFGNRIMLCKGWFKDTLFVANNESFCFVHIDSDRYESTKQCLEFFWPRMVSGGFMFFDDYGLGNTPGVKKAVDEFFDNKSYDVFKIGGKPIIKVL